VVGSSGILPFRPGGAGGESGSFQGAAALTDEAFHAAVAQAAAAFPGAVGRVEVAAEVAEDAASTRLERSVSGCGPAQVNKKEGPIFLDPPLLTALNGHVRHWTKSKRSNIPFTPASMAVSAPDHMTTSTGAK
jgi:hypothetical protein